MTTSNNNWDQSKESINAHYDEIDKQSEKLFQEKKISRDELERKKRSTQLCREYKISHLEYIQRAKDFESGKKINSKDSKSNKVTEKPIKQLKSVISAAEYSALPDADKMYYQAKVLPTANEGAASCIDCINKLSPVISTIAPVTSVIAPIQPMVDQVSSVQSLISTASSALSALNGVISAADGLASSQVLSPVAQPLKDIVQSIFDLVKTMATIGYVVYTQGPDMYKNVMDGMKEFEKNKDEAKKALEDSKKITEAQALMIKEEAEAKKKATEEAMKDTSKNYISADDIVISEATYNRLSEEDKKKYKEETTADKIRLACKKIEIPEEFKKIIDQAKSLVGTVDTFFTTTETTAEAVKTATQGIDISKVINEALGTIGINIPSYEDIMKSVQKDAASIDLIGKSVDIKNKLSSFKSEYVLINKQ